MRKLNSIWSKDKKYKLGAIVDSFTYAMFWLGLVGFAFNALTGYNIWAKPWASTFIPDFNLLWFILILSGIIVLLMLFEFLVLYKARQYFRNKWEYEHSSPIKQDLKNQNKKIDKIMRKLGIEETNEDLINKP